MNEFNYIQLSDEQKEQLYQEFKLRARIEEEAREGEFDIPEEILENLDNTSKGELKTQFKRYHKSLPQYKRGTWTSAETINKCFHADLKRDNLDSYQVVCRDYRHSEKLRTAATAATEIYEELSSLIDGENHVLINALEKARRLAVFAFANAKFIDQEAKELAAKALKLPPNIRNFAEEEETDKILAFSSEKVEQVHKARFEQSLLRNASRSGYTPPSSSSIIPSTSQDSHYEIPEDGISPGGRLQAFTPYWKKTIHHPWPLSVIQEGYQIQWNSTPHPWKYHPTKRPSMEDRIAVSEAVKKFLAAGIIEISPTQSKHYLSHFFTVKEPTKRRPILDCRPLNKFVQCHHFKMEGIPALRSLLEKDDLICKIDLKDAYVVVPLHQQSRRFLTFLHQGTVYQYKSLAFGLSVAPRIFSKLMRYAVEPLRRKGIKLVYYLDDICLVAKSMKEMNANMQETLAHLKNLGFLINYKKSSLQPQKIQEFLGFQFNTSTMQITLPQQKLKKIVSRIRQRDLAKSLHVHHQNWESPCQLTRKSFEDLQWWENFSGQHNGLPIHKEDFKTPAIDIYVDASDSGYGVSSAELETHGFWTKEEQSTSINQVPDTPSVCSYPRNQKHQSGSLEPTSQTFLRVELTTAIFPKDSEKVGPSDNRRICGPSQQLATEILEYPTRSSSNEHRCVQTTLAKTGTVFASTVEVDSASAEKISATKGTRGDTGNSILADPVLVSNDSTNDKNKTVTFPNIQDLATSRLEVIRQAMEKQDLDVTTIRHLQQKHRQETVDSYNRHWAKWVSWCNIQSPKINCLEYAPKNVLRYLVHNRQFSTSHLNGIRSSIASVFNVVYPSRPSIGQHHLIQDFFTAHKKQQVIVPSKEKLEIWDLDILLRFIKSRYADTEKLPVMDLQRKTVLLLSIFTMWRPKSDIS
ncbi:hypothetical protein RO3G_03516 [Rhizopus delemar RA 99-880]|uniref:Reverse transcriptase domain-containing protein n=1 Tax=Rhizopus delemar (strain RA 99-880 / ATCC MYA-4621 / FGSC 9543 / NRRL 43880) TaxID=246409 RepID=I1BRI1_RHIO9|nr:hypothetical protein RO3G_03516 [Rhizopus delemar RA 99-880]|eukprot:EIE78811.1 hypothetical protein RO3G_03516 [Rhizopus delemar RA 99-880]